MIKPCGGYYKIITLFSFDLILNWFIDILTNVSIGCLQMFDRVTVFENVPKFQEFCQIFSIIYLYRILQNGWPIAYFYCLVLEIREKLHFS